MNRVEINVLGSRNVFNMDNNGNIVFADGTTSTALQEVAKLEAALDMLFEASGWVDDADWSEVV